MSYRQWPYRVKTKRRGVSIYVVRYFQTMQAYLGWRLRRDEDLLSVEIRA